MQLRSELLQEHDVRRFVGTQELDIAPTVRGFERAQFLARRIDAGNRELEHGVLALARFREDDIGLRAAARGFAQRERPVPCDPCSLFRQRRVPRLSRRTERLRSPAHLVGNIERMFGHATPYIAPFPSLTTRRLRARAPGASI